MTSDHQTHDTIPSPPSEPTRREQPRPTDDVRELLDEISRGQRQMLANQEMLALSVQGNHDETRVRMGNYERELHAIRSRVTALEQAPCSAADEIRQLRTRLEELAALVESDGR